MSPHKVISLCLLLCLLPQVALGDRIVLRNGQKIDGTIANRDEIERDLSGQDVIAILVEDSLGASELRRVQLFEIEYLVLEDAQGKRVLDVASLVHKTSPEASVTQQDLGRGWVGRDWGRRRDTGMMLMVGGGFLGGVGALVKFGPEKVEITESDVKYHEKTYNAANYILMGAGALLAVVGISLIVSDIEGSRTGISVNHGSSGAHYMGLRFRF